MMIVPVMIAVVLYYVSSILEQKLCRLMCARYSPGQNTGVGRLPLLQGIFPIRNRTWVSCITGGFFTSWATGEASPRILEWVTYPFSSRSSQPRNWTRDSCNAGRFFTNFTIREAVEWALTDYLFQGMCLFDLSLKFMSIKLSVISFLILILSANFVLMSSLSFLILIINIFFNCPWSL